ncbi:PEP-CTERM system TPR-repeat lipoprotein [Psychroflexus gondwanensis ACAM 44]|uniref:PEP-CTERM system TPR-repeat lipoprotein n=1 Tax=Psychroflexus gondwanensis ACAM 44 TaxID=1189619 RepID=N1WMA0_9FLAO|nr:tetratricopeptide repeat protein [Psychroflexus gondwanensis]EMY81406.1 PEP-CTERM system TPR-repeat lipoprotein [Psychroflexus gondwanensis ACAM 44]
MKKSILAVALIGATSLSFSQRGEIRDAESAVEDKNFKEALTQLDIAKPLLADEKDKWVVRYHLAKAKTHGNLASTKSGDEMISDMDTALKSVESVLAMENDNEEALAYQNKLRQTMVQTAIDGQGNGNYDMAEKLLYKTYELDRNDTVMLYYAASAAVNGKIYDKALSHYQKLLDIGFDGSTEQFIAINKETGEEEIFESKNMRDISVKTGEYSDPSQKKTPSLTGEIAKNITLIYIQEDQPDKALEAIKKAKEENPDDVSLLQAEADLYYRIGKIDKYDEMMKQVVKMDPENPSLYYNLGVASEQLGDEKSSKEYYKKAIELDSEMVNAYINLAALTLNKERDIVEEMNSLGNSRADNKKYQELNEQKKQFYKDALPYLEKASELDPKNMSALQTKLNIYYQLEMNEKAKALQEKINSLQE